MPLIYQKRIYRQDLHNNPEVWYVFGDNLAGVGYGGQAREMRGESNAIGIPTKRSPYEYLNDNDYDEIVQVCTKIFNRLYYKIEAGGIVVWPGDGIGTGLSDLINKAPKIWCWLDDMKRELHRYAFK